MYTLNRSLTGMEIITYTNKNMAVNPNDPASVLAQKLLEEGSTSVSIYSNVVTIVCDEAVFSSREKDIARTIEGLFTFYS